MPRFTQIFAIKLYSPHCLYGDRLKNMMPPTDADAEAPEKKRKQQELQTRHIVADSLTLGNYVIGN